MNKKVLSWFLLISAIEGLLCGLALYQERSVQSLFFGTGFTIKDFFVLISVIVFSVILFLLFGLNLYSTRLTEITTKLREYPRFLNVVLFISILIVFECVQILIFLDSISAHGKNLYHGYSQFLISILPLLIYAGIFCLQLICLNLFLRRKEITIQGIIDLVQKQDLFLILLIPLLLLVFRVFGLRYIPHTNRQEISDVVGDMAPLSAPIVKEQVIIVFIFVVLLAYVMYRSKGLFTDRKWFKSEFWIYLVIWTIGYMLWSNLPIEENWYIDMSTNPLLTIYPGSDSFYYDKEAFSLILMGEFLDNTTHVMYSYFVMILHLLGGVNYLGFIKYQIAFLAISPVILYMFSSYLYSKEAGFFISLLFILREQNGLHLAADIDGSLVNQLMTECFAIMFVISFLYLVIRWLEDDRLRKILPYLAGAVMGVGLLTRSELLAVLLAVSCVSLFHLWKDKKVWWDGMIKIWLIVLVIIIPWMTRNYYRLGSFSLDKAGFVQKKVTQFIDELPWIDLQQIPESSEEEIWADYLQEATPSYNPTITKIVNHIANSTWQPLLYLPSNYQPLFTISENLPFQYKFDPESGLFSENYINRYVRSQPYYWFDWDGEIKKTSVLPIVENLILISIGVIIVKGKRPRSWLIMPSALAAIIVIWAFAGYSGGRFIKTTDWISMLFYGIGFFWLYTQLVQKIIPGLSKFLHSNQISTISERSELNISQDKIFLICIILMIIVGFAPVGSELILPPRYDHEKMAQAIELIDENSLIPEVTLSSKSLQIYGKALYPRYFKEGESLPDDRRGTIPPPNQSRFDFYIIGTEKYWISLPIEKPEQLFPHYSDVIVFGSLKRDSDIDLRQGYLPYIQADLVFLINEDGSLEQFTCEGGSCFVE